MFNDWIVKFLRIWYLALSSQITACLSFLICKMGVVLVAATWRYDWWEEWRCVKCLKEHLARESVQSQLMSSAPCSTEAATPLSMAMTALAGSLFSDPRPGRFQIAAFLGCSLSRPLRGHCRGCAAWRIVHRHSTQALLHLKSGLRHFSLAYGTLVFSSVKRLW